jgi:protein-tyrosine-phosphatase
MTAALHISFVCRFNRARSPMAAAVFAEQLRRRGLGDVVRISSAGTYPSLGGGVDPRAAQLLLGHGYPVRATHRATQLGNDHLGADLVVALGYEHVGLLQRRGDADERIRYVEVRIPAMELISRTFSLLLIPRCLHSTLG